jgi:hypothetical protein
MTANSWTESIFGNYIYITSKWPQGGGNYTDIFIRYTYIYTDTANLTYTPAFRVLEDGSLYASGFFAAKGSLGGFTFSSDYLYGKDTVFNEDKGGKRLFIAPGGWSYTVDQVNECVQ